MKKPDDRYCIHDPHVHSLCMIQLAPMASTASSRNPAVIFCRSQYRYKNIKLNVIFFITINLDRLLNDSFGCKLLFLRREE